MTPKALNSDSPYCAEEPDEPIQGAEVILVGDLLNAMCCWKRQAFLRLV